MQEQHPFPDRKTQLVTAHSVTALSVTALSVAALNVAAASLAILATPVNARDDPVEKKS